MDQQQLIDRLEARVADVPVGAPPLDAMRTAVRRRRSRVTVLAAAVAVAALGTGAAVWQAADPDPQPPVASETPDIDLPPAGHRYVGVGAAVIAVPDAWGTNEMECATPVQDTVLIDLGMMCMMDVPRPADVESVEVRSSTMPDTAEVWAPFEVDGELALRSPILTSSGMETVTSASVFLTDSGVLFTAESSSPDSESIVTELLEGITLLEEHTTVPGYNGVDLDSYLQRLQELGLTVEVVEKTKPMWEDGTVLAIEPAAGTVVAPGDTVTVTVAR